MLAGGTGEHADCTQRAKTPAPPGERPRLGNFAHPGVGQVHAGPNPTITRVDTHRIDLAITQLRNADEWYRMRLASRTEDEDAFAQAGDELLRSVSTAVLVIGEELTRQST